MTARGRGHTTDRKAGAATASLRRVLTSLRARIRRLLVAEALMRMAAWAVGAVLVLVVLDFLLRFPRELRFVIWGAGLAGLVICVRAWVLPAWRFCPSLTDLALRIGRGGASPDAQTGEIVASGLDFSGESGKAEGLAPALAEKVILDAAARSAQVRVLASKLVSARRAGWAALWMVVLVGAGFGAHVAWPSTATIGVQRIVAPWSSASWPKPTQVVHAGEHGVHPMGLKLEVQGLLTRTRSALGKTPVFVRARIDIPGREPIENRVRLISQQRIEEIGGQRGELYKGELSIPPAEAGGAVEGWVEYRIETAHDTTGPVRIRLAAPPTIRSASVRMKPPVYASGIAGYSTGSGIRDLGPGVDERAVVGPMLAGSEVEIRIEFNKPIPREANDWTAAFHEAIESGSGEVQFEGASIVMKGVLAQSLRLDVRAVDGFGLEMSDYAGVFSFDVVRDEPPGASILEPMHDEAVLATAVVRVLAEGRDDVGVRSLSIEHQPARLPAGSASVAPEAAGSWNSIAIQSPEPALRQVRASVDVDLRELGLRAGEELWLTALVDDVYEMEGERHPPVRSALRRVIVIGESTFVERIRSELNSVRQAAQRIDDRQRDAAARLATTGPSEGVRQDQQAISEQIASQREVLERLSQRIATNRLDDPALTALVQDAIEAVREAGDASDRASGALEAAAEGEAEQAEAAREQTAVRDELHRLAEMLDRGQDGWLARRDVERLLEAQQELRELTDAIAGATAGRSIDQLSERELSELERIAQRQQELADRAEQVLDSLSERSRDLADVDPATASGFAQASTRGRQDQIASEMRRASDDVRQNQPGQAGGAQQRAMESLERMLADIEAAERNRHDMLRRALASILESLDGLIVQQRRELQALIAARAISVLEGRADAQLRIQVNTLGVLDQIERAGSELEVVARMVSDAATAQGEGVRALRSEPAADARAEEMAALALQRLEQAREEAQRIEQAAAERDQAQRRAELRAAYRSLLEQQVALRSETAPLIDLELTRRDRQRARTLGEKQRTLRELMSELLTQTAELEEAAMFRFAHERLDAASREAAEVLLDGRADRVVQRRQDGIVRLLQSLLEALAEESRPQDFRDHQDGGSQGQGGQGGQNPPLVEAIVELKLLRAMQQEALERTRMLDEANGLDEAEVREVAELQEELMRLGEDLIRRLTRPSGAESGDPFSGMLP
ncbi:MAG: hypothetical protein KF866_12960 [Phycisphaeraceae bacterium]|nr:hypothetical protein [Phycisphaeraceae bacterium]MCW5754166.1 hypothetical protein [Phycisphaeraceae bacterium]